MHALGVRFSSILGGWGPLWGAISAPFASFCSPVGALFASKAHPKQVLQNITVFLSKIIGKAPAIAPET